MDTNYTTQLFLSMLFFAPGVILFVGLAFVGILMVLEKTVFKTETNAVLTPATEVDLVEAANPAPGAIVTALKESTKQPAAKQQRKANQ